MRWLAVAGRAGDEVEEAVSADPEQSPAPGAGLDLVVAPSHLQTPPLPDTTTSDFLKEAPLDGGRGEPRARTLLATLLDEACPDRSVLKICVPSFISCRPITAPLRWRRWQPWSASRDEFSARN